WGQGVGSRLTASLLNIADNWLNLKRVELEVYTDNAPAIYLYKKFGFLAEGVRRKVAFGDGHWLDDLVMARFHGIDPDSARTFVGATSSPQPPASQVAGEVTIRPVRVADISQLHDLSRHPAVARTTLQIPSQEISRTEE